MNPNIETIERLYQSALKHFDMPEFNTFLADIQQDDNLMRFRESMSEYYDMPDFNTLKSDLFDLTTQPETEVQEAEVQQETNIDFDLAKKLATDIRNKNEDDDDVLLTEDELKSPIGSIDIFSDRVRPGS